MWLCGTPWLWSFTQRCWDVNNIIHPREQRGCSFPSIVYFNVDIYSSKKSTYSFLSYCICYGKCFKFYMPVTLHFLWAPTISKSTKQNHTYYPPKKPSMSHKETISIGHFIFQPSIFRAYVSFHGGEVSSYPALPTSLQALSCEGSPMRRVASQRRFCWPWPKITARPWHGRGDRDVFRRKET